jgi:pentapeptide MXKDX repeat protein
MFIGLAPIQEVSRIRAAEASGDGTFPLWAHRMGSACRFCRCDRNFQIRGDAMKKLVLTGLAMCCLGIVPSNFAAARAPMQQDQDQMKQDDMKKDDMSKDQMKKDEKKKKKAKKDKMKKDDMKKDNDMKKDDKGPGY